MTYAELQELAALPLLTLVERAHAVHRAHWPEGKVQVCTLLSLKTGNCSEDCAYCAQSARHHTGLTPDRGLMPKQQVLERALQARADGATRFCMGAAWRGIRTNDPRFAELLDIVRSVRALGLEVCATLGIIGQAEADALRDAGLSAYNHNLDTSPEYYPEIVSTHRYEDRLETISHIQRAGIRLCCGGIIGLGEAPEDRLRLLEVVSGLQPQPESFPINALITIPGTPMSRRRPDAPDALETVRMVALARLALPQSHVRLSAGRERLSPEAQALCFYAGANSLFLGERLLTARNAPPERDIALLERLGLQAELPHEAALPPGSAPDDDNEPHPCFREGPCTASSHHHES